MNKLGEELDNLLNKYKRINTPNEVGSYDLTEESEIKSIEENKE